MQEIRIATVADVEELEKVPFEQRLKAKNTYEMLQLGAAIDPEAPAISFMLSGETYNSPMIVNYREFWRKINQTANMFHDLGVGPTDVITYLLPNLPHTHFGPVGRRGRRRRQPHQSHAGGSHHCRNLRGGRNKNPGRPGRGSRLGYMGKGGNGPGKGSLHPEDRAGVRRQRRSQRHRGF